MKPTKMRFFNYTKKTSPLFVFFWCHPKDSTKKGEVTINIR